MSVRHTREASLPRILITEPIAQEGIDLLRYELPEAQIEVRLGLSSREPARDNREIHGPHSSQPDTRHRRTAGQSHPLTGHLTRRIGPGQH